MGTTRQRCFGVAVAIILLAAMCAEGSVIFQSGSIHADASVSYEQYDRFGNRSIAVASDNPADKILTSSSGGSQSATASGGGYTATGSTSFSMTNGFAISSSVQTIGYHFDYPTGISTTRGTVQFTETATEPFTLTQTTTLAVYNDSTITIKNATNATIVSYRAFGDPSPGPQAFVLTPGQYTLAWSINGKYAAFSPGSCTTGVSIVATPEPASVALAALMGCVALRRRHR